MKRFRDENGRLLFPISTVAELTRSEADEYYQDGAWYTHQGKLYQLRRFTNTDAHGTAVDMATLTSADGCTLFLVPERLGTFLPDVASDGLEIVRAAV